MASGSVANASATSSSSGSAAAAARGPLAGTLLLAFIGGLILNLMPCVFPVLGIKILGFVNQAGHERSRIVAHGLVFTLGAKPVQRSGNHTLTVRWRVEAIGS